jgi:hypothetical protein
MPAIPLTEIQGEAMRTFISSVFVLMAFGSALADPPPAQPDIAKLIGDLSSDDGQVRADATKAIFALGKDALEPLKKAGAKQISPSGTISTRRIDMVYSLLEGLKTNPNRQSGYATNGFGLRVTKDCTQKDVAKMGETFGFTISGNFAAENTPSCYVTLKPGKKLADVLKAILSEEPKVISVNLNYFET